MKYNKIIKENEYNKNSFLITTISCIVLLLVLCYFGINSGVKGTYSATNYTYENKSVCATLESTYEKTVKVCTEGKEIDGYCCPNDSYSWSVSMATCQSYNITEAACDAYGFSYITTGTTSKCTGKLGTAKNQTQCSSGKAKTSDGSCCPSGTSYQDILSGYCVKSGYTLVDNVGYAGVSTDLACRSGSATTTPTQNTVKFDANGGKTSSGATTFSIKCTPGSTGACSISPSQLQTVTRSGYDFKGWTSTENCPSNMGSTATLTVYGNNSTMYACWKATTTTCKAGTYYKGQGNCSTSCLAGYYCPGGTFNNSDSSRDGLKECPSGKTSGTNATKESDCYTPSSGGGDSDDDDDDPTPTPSKKKFTATFDPNGGKLDGDKTKTCEATNSCTITVPGANRDGYTFKGWGTSKNCSSGYTNSVSLNSDKTFYACWVSDSSDTDDDSTPSLPDDDLDDNVSDNPPTGQTTMIAIIWFVGLMAIGYAFYYFKSVREN